MVSAFPNSLPDTHRKFLTSAIDLLQRDARLVGVAAGGSFLTDPMDELSDLDLVIAVEPSDLSAVMNDRHRIGGLLGPLLGAFTGEDRGDEESRELEEEQSAERGEHLPDGERPAPDGHGERERRESEHSQSEQPCGRRAICQHEEASDVVVHGALRAINNRIQLDHPKQIALE